MTKVAIFIDGGYFLKRLPRLRRGLDAHNVDHVTEAIRELIKGHLCQINQTYGVCNYWQLLHRAFYYDARPYTRSGHTPVQGRAINYSQTSEAIFRNNLFEALRRYPDLALRLGEVRRNGNQPWQLKASSQKQLLRGEREFSEIGDEDFVPTFRQKGVDMRIGLDIAWVALRRHAQIIVLVSGDADFVPAAKLARREGIRFILDSLGQHISPDLSEHIDRRANGFNNPDTGDG